MKTIITTFFICCFWVNLGISQDLMISKGPFSQIDCQGNTIQLFLESNADEFQWERKRPQDEDFIPIDGANQSIYLINESGDSQNPHLTQYRVILKKGDQKMISSIIDIQLNSPGKITNTLLCEGGSCLFTIQEGNYLYAEQYSWEITNSEGIYEEIGSNEAILVLENIPADFNKRKLRLKTSFQVSSYNDNEGRISENPTNCIRYTDEISLKVSSLPIPSHTKKSYSGCENESLTVSSMGCSPNTTEWRNEMGEIIGTGARASLLIKENTRFFALCENKGCRGSLSSGIDIQAIKKPLPPENDGTPLSILSGENIVFKASGGTNNIWYLNKDDKKPYSTAKEIKLTNIINETEGEIVQSVWVSQELLGCESERREISVRILPKERPEETILPQENLTPIPSPQNPLDLPQEIIQDPVDELADPLDKQAEPFIEVPNPIELPDPTQEIEQPTLEEPTLEEPRMEEPTIKEPITEEPTIQEPKNDPMILKTLEITFIQKCWGDSIVILHPNCPTIPYIYIDSIKTPIIHDQFFLEGEKDFSILIPCQEEGYIPTILNYQPKVQPSLEIQFNSSELYYEDTLKISAIPPGNMDFYWEMDNHFISKEKNLSIILIDTLEIIGVIHQDGCFHRSEPIEFSPIPKPILKQLEKNFLIMEDPFYNSEIRIQPNPIPYYMINLEFPEQIERGQISIFSMNGILKFEKEFIIHNKRFSFSIPELANGMYLLNFKSDRWEQTKKIMIEN